MFERRYIFQDIFFGIYVSFLGVCIKKNWDGLFPWETKCCVSLMVTIFLRKFHIRALDKCHPSLLPAPETNSKTTWKMDSWKTNRFYFGWVRLLSVLGKEKTQVLFKSHIPGRKPGMTLPYRSLT